MNRSTTRTSAGVLAAAEDRLAALVARAERLADETGWECAAARAYRADLAEWVALIRRLGTDVESLQHDARTALASSSGLPR